MSMHPSPRQENREASTEDRLRRLEAFCRRIPARTITTKALRTLVVGKGQTLYSGAVTIYGVKAISTNWTADLPAATPTPGSTYTDGLGYAYPVDADGSVSATPVWFMNNYGNLNGAATGSGVIYHLPEGSRVFAVTIAAQPYTGGGGLTAPLYLAWRS